MYQSFLQSKITSEIEPDPKRTNGEVKKRIWNARIQRYSFDLRRALFSSSCLYQTNNNLNILQTLALALTTDTLYWHDERINMCSKWTINAGTDTLWHTPFTLTHTKAYSSMDRVRRDRGRARGWSVDIENISINTKKKRERERKKKQPTNKRTKSLRGHIR